jgi:hypothetical protein
VVTGGEQPTYISATIIPGNGSDTATAGQVGRHLEIRERLG